MLLDQNYFRTFKLGNLYFRFIKGTHLEALGWTSETLAKLLVEQGYIKVIEIQPQDSKGRWMQKEVRYVELPGRSLTKKAFTQMTQTLGAPMSIKLGLLILASSLLHSCANYELRRDVDFQAIGRNSGWTDKTPSPIVYKANRQCITVPHRDGWGNVSYTTECN